MRPCNSITVATTDLRKGAVQVIERNVPEWIEGIRVHLLHRGQVGFGHRAQSHACGQGRLQDGAAAPFEHDDVLRVVKICTRQQFAHPALHGNDGHLRAAIADDLAARLFP